MNGSPEHQDAPAASSTSSDAPSPAAPTTPSPATPSPATPSPATPSPATPSPAAPAPAVPSAPPTSAAQAAAAPAAQAPVPPAPTYPAPHPSAAGQPVPPGGGVSRLHRKSPFLAGLLSLMPGIGQIYVGYYKIGFLHIAVFAMTITLLASGPAQSGMLFSRFVPLYPALGIFLGFFVIYNIVDAVHRATLYNLAVEGVQGIELPDMNASLPKLQGSMGGGVALIVFGVILLSNTLFGLSLDWLASWWPLGLIALGGYLVAKAKAERRDGGMPGDGSS